MSFARVMQSAVRHALPATRIAVPSFTAPCAVRSAPAAVRSFHSSFARCGRQEEEEQGLPGKIVADIPRSTSHSLTIADLPSGTLSMLASCLPKLIFGVSSTPLIPFQIRTTPEALRPLALILKSNTLTQMTSITDIAVTDKVEQAGRFSVKYLFYSFAYNQRFIIELFARETTIVPSLAAPFAMGQSIFAGAGWLEREAYDMYGIYFSEHGDLRRILTDYGFTGHPLRKDFPLTGFSEVVYNDAEGRVTPEPVELSQEFRVFHL